MSIRLLSLEKIYATILYYLANHERIDEYIRRGDEIGERFYQDSLTQPESDLMQLPPESGQIGTRASAGRDADADSSESFRDGAKHAMKAVKYVLDEDVVKYLGTAIGRVDPKIEVRRVVADRRAWHRDEGSDLVAVG